MISLGVSSEQEGTPSARGYTHETQKVGVPKTRPALYSCSPWKMRVSGARRRQMRKPTSLSGGAI